MQEPETIFHKAQRDTAYHQEPGDTILHGLEVPLEDLLILRKIGIYMPSFFSLSLSLYLSLSLSLSLSYTTHALVVNKLRCNLRMPELIKEAWNHDNVTSSEQLCMLIDNTIVLEGVGGKIDSCIRDAIFASSQFKINIPSLPGIHTPFSYEFRF